MSDRIGLNIRQRKNLEKYLDEWASKELGPGLTAGQIKAAKDLHRRLMEPLCDEETIEVEEHLIGENGRKFPEELKENLMSFKFGLKNFPVWDVNPFLDGEPLKGAYPKRPVIYHVTSSNIATHILIELPPGDYKSLTVRYYTKGYVLRNVYENWD